MTEQAEQISLTVEEKEEENCRWDKLKLVYFLGPSFIGAVCWLALLSKAQETNVRWAIWVSAAVIFCVYVMLIMETIKELKAEHEKIIEDNNIKEEKPNPD